MALRSGASGRFTFAEINSALIKSLRRGDEYLALEMVKEYKYKPKCLKRIMISTCCDDCPNLYLINDIYNTHDNIENLILLIPAICKHVKSRVAKFAFRVACTKPLNDEPIADSDDLITTLSKMYTTLCKNDRNMNPILSYFMSRIKDVKIADIHRYMNRSLSFLYLLATWKCLDYMTDANYERPLLSINIPIASFIDMYEVETLPEYVYDYTINTSPAKNRTFEYYFSTYVIYPRYKENTSLSALEQEGEALFIKYGKMSHHYIRPILECGTMPENAKLIAIKQQMSKYMRKARQQFYNFIPNDKDPEYNESIAHVIINSKMYQSYIYKRDRASKMTGVDSHINFNTKTLFNVESNTYSFNGSSYKRRIYFCSVHNDEYKHIIKGPFNNILSIRIRLLSDYLKSYLSLPNSNATVKEYADDLYIFSRNVIGMDVREIKQIKDREFYYYDGPMYKYYHFKASRLKSKELMKLFKLLIFRFMIGATTTHAYDFVLYEDEFYSFDDAVSFAYRYALFTERIERDAIEVYESFIKRKFKCLQTFIQETEASILKNEILDVNQKIFIVKQLNVLKDKSGWIITNVAEHKDLI